MSTPAEILVRGWTIKIADTLAGAAAGQVIGGIDTMSLGSSSNKADTTVWTDNGINTHLVASRAKTVTFSGKYQVDASDGVRDAGQTAVEAAAELVDVASVKYFYLTDPSTINHKTFAGTVTMGDIGGGNDDATSWGFTVDITGAIS